MGMGMETAQGLQLQKTDASQQMDTQIDARARIDPQLLATFVKACARWHDHELALRALAKAQAVGLKPDRHMILMLIQSHTAWSHYLATEADREATSDEAMDEAEGDMDEATADATADVDAGAGAEKAKGSGEGKGAAAGPGLLTSPRLLHSTH